MGSRRRNLLCSALLLIALVASAAQPQHDSGTASPRAYPHLFPYQQGWLGADAAYSVPLGNGKSLWFFDDTFLGAPDATSRRQATGFIHNSVGISHCSGLKCSFQYFWRVQSAAKPQPIFAAPGSDWFWAMDAFLCKGTLYIALMQMHAAGSGAFGFAYSGAQLASIPNYTEPPSQWKIRYQPLNRGGMAVPGVSVVANQGPGGNPDPSNPHGADYAYFFTLAGKEPYLALLRVPLAELDRLARPGHAHWQVLDNKGLWETWKDSATVLPVDSAKVMRPGATEMTVRWHRATQQWIAVYPVGLERDAHYSLSSSLTTGWSRPRKLFAYPEMDASNPNFTPHLFCYADKEHVEFENPGELAFTYVCNSTQENEVTRNGNLYHPILVIRSLPKE